MESGADLRATEPRPLGRVQSRQALIDPLYGVRPALLEPSAARTCLPRELRCVEIEAIA